LKRLSSDFGDFRLFRLSTFDFGKLATFDFGDFRAHGRGVAFVVGGLFRFDRRPIPGAIPGRQWP
jgi:hypothetical protein